MCQITARLAIRVIVHSYPLDEMHDIEGTKMSTNLLIVCGSVGRSVMHQHALLGFHDALYIDHIHINPDVQGDSYEATHQRYHGRLFQLPQLPDHTTESNISILIEYAQRLDSQWQTYHHHMGHLDHHGACTDSMCHDFRRRINHVKTVMSHTPPLSIMDGFSAPIVARAYITRPDIHYMLVERLTRFLRLRLANDNSITIWFVASTCGNTGNGIVHHVADVVKQILGDVTVNIKFLRIGATTFRSVLNNRADTATFWSILTDHQYISTTRQTQYQHRDTNVTQEFYYIDGPDTSTDYRAREAWVIMALTALTQEIIAQQCTHLLKINRSSMIMVCVGTWQKNMMRSTIYASTFTQFHRKLHELIHPRVAVSSECVVQLSTLFSRQTYSYIQSSTPAPQILARITTIAQSNHQLQLPHFQTHPHWGMMQQLVAHFFDAQQQNNLCKNIQVSTTINSFLLSTFADNIHHVNDHEIGSATHIQNIRLAHIAKAVIPRYLFGQNNTPGYITTELYESWNRLTTQSSTIPLIGRFMIDPQARTLAFEAGIIRFLQAYFCVMRCMEIVAVAENVITHAQAQFHDIMKTINQHIQHIAAESSQSTYTQSAELAQTVAEHTTWLQLVMHALQKYTITSDDFRTAMIQGVNGLSETGLQYILGVPSDTTAEQMLALINTHVGDQNTPATWWQHMPPSMQEHSGIGWLDYRMFPMLSNKLISVFSEANATWESKHQQTPPTHLYHTMSPSIQAIYAIQCITHTADEADLLHKLIPRLQYFVHTPEYHMLGKDAQLVQHYIKNQCIHCIGLPMRISPNMINDNMRSILELMSEHFVIHHES